MTQKHHQLYGYTKFIILGVLILAGLLANGPQDSLIPTQTEGLMNASAPNMRDTIRRYFPDEAVIDGLMANAEHESRLDPTSFEYKPVWGKDDEQGYGLFQFTGQQLTDYVNWLESNQTQDSAAAQLQFVHANIYTNSQGTAGPHDIGGVARDQLQNDFNSGDPGRIARSFAINYEKMADQGQPDARSTTANAYFPDRRRTKPTASKPFPPGTYSGNDANMTLIHPGPKNLIR